MDPEKNERTLRVRYGEGRRHGWSWSGESQRLILSLRHSSRGESDGTWHMISACSLQQHETGFVLLVVVWYLLRMEEHRRGPSDLGSRFSMSVAISTQGALQFTLTPWLMTPAAARSIKNKTALNWKSMIASTASKGQEV